MGQDDDRSAKICGKQEAGLAKTGGWIHISLQALGIRQETAAVRQRLWALIKYRGQGCVRDKVAGNFGDSFVLL